MRSAFRKVYIIGFMGSGKTTAGKKLATALGWSFIDLDNKIEEETGKTIPEIFKEYGEEYFRDTETKVLRNLKCQKDTVISTGGGAPCHSGNMNFMIDTGLTIYLKLTPGQLCSRLSDSDGARPLIMNLDRESLRAFIKEKLSEREKCYRMAAMTVRGLDLDINTLHASVISALKI
jgi:shikimate kinase